MDRLRLPKGFNLLRREVVKLLFIGGGGGGELTLFVDRTNEMEPDVSTSPILKGLAVGWARIGRWGAASGQNVQNLFSESCLLFAQFHRS